MMNDEEEAPAESPEAGYGNSEQEYQSARYSLGEVKSSSEDDSQEDGRRFLAKARARREERTRAAMTATKQEDELPAEPEPLAAQPTPVPQEAPVAIGPPAPDSLAVATTIQRRRYLSLSADTRCGLRARRYAHGNKEGGLSCCIQGRTASGQV